MIDCETADEAIAAYRPEPGDRVEFAWWDVPCKLEELPNCS
jgi:Alcohol dehydrogenase GroES-like domain